MRVFVRYHITVLQLYWQLFHSRSKAEDEIGGLHHLTEWEVLPGTRSYRDMNWRLVKQLGEYSLMWGSSVGTMKADTPRFPSTAAMWRRTSAMRSSVRGLAAGSEDMVEELIGGVEVSDPKPWMIDHDISALKNDGTCFTWRMGL